MQLLGNINSTVGNFPEFIASILKPYLNKRCDTFQAGYIAKCLPSWQKITNDSEIISTVTGMPIPFDSNPTQHYLPDSKRTQQETLLIDAEIQKLFSKQAIEPTGHTVDEVISDIFLREKKDGKFRMILNLKKLNQFTTKKHFKMDTLTTIMRLVEKDCFMACLDLKDAYYSVPIAKKDRKYLRFKWQGQLYQFTCLPNGLSCAPRKFTKLLKPALSELHMQGHLSSGYIDDIYLQGKTYHACLTNVVDTVTQFDSLGFVAHPDKSIFEPTQNLEILGFQINSVRMIITLTEEKAHKLRNKCMNLREQVSPTIREVASAIGKIVSAFPGVMYGPLHYRHLEHDKTTALHRTHWNFDKHMDLTPLAIAELDWWISNVLTSKNVLSRDHPSSTLTTDASNEGWGAVVEQSSTGGLWSAGEKMHHINYLELLAVFLGLQAFYQTHHDIHVRLMIDNSTAVAVINHMGTSHSTVLNALCKQIWEWCVLRNIWISAAHIPGKANTEADLESRENRTETEWMLNKDLLTEALDTLNFRPDIDMFASRLNKQFDCYVAYRPDPGAAAIDALSIHWGGKLFYAFPPFSLIPLVLKKIQEDKASGICVLPYWPAQPWFPKAMDMLVQKQVRLEPSATLLQLPSQPLQRHPLHKKLSLLVCHLSGSN